MQVYFMYSACCSGFLSSSFANELNQQRIQRIQMKPLKIRQKLTNFFQPNFSNYRKFKIVDGQIGFLGGINIGEKYYLLAVETYWRDTQLELRAPFVRSLQASFL